jgi:CRISPR/Cas system-associated endonuclease Cas1
MAVEASPPDTRYAYHIRTTGRELIQDATPQSGRQNTRGLRLPQPALRRAQALVCSGVIPTAAVAIAREILRVKLHGQAEVARLLGSADASAAIGSLATAIARETDGSKALSFEARAALIYWKLWEDMPVRFAVGGIEPQSPDPRVGVAPLPL